MKLKNLGKLLLTSALALASLSVPDMANAVSGTVGTGTCASSVSDLSTVSAISTGGNCIFTFASGTTTITLPSDVTSMNFLLVGGGGGGSAYPTRACTPTCGAWRGFPGGGGGMVWTATISVNSSQIETITVGAGGSAGAVASAGGTGGSTSLQTSTSYTASGGSAGGRQVHSASFPQVATVVALHQIQQVH